MTEQKPYVELDNEVLVAMDISEAIATQYRYPDSTITDEACISRGVLHALTAQNRMLYALIESMNEGFKGLDAFIDDIQKTMGGEPLDDTGFPV